jgi:hypothetical protein
VGSIAMRYCAMALELEKPKLTRLARPSSAMCAPRRYGRIADQPIQRGVQTFARTFGAGDGMSACTATRTFPSSNQMFAVLSRYEVSVVGSIILFTAVIFVAGNPLILACSRMIASSLAR